MAKKIKVWDGTKWEDVTPSLPVALIDHTHSQSDVTNLTTDLAAKAPLASPTFTGTPLSTTAAVDTNTTQIATTAYVVGQGYLKSSTASSTYAPLNLTQNAQAASYTTVLADAGKLVEISNASANNLTVPLNASVAYPIGTQINILQTGAGQTTVVPTGGVTINATPGLKLRAQWSSATLIKRATDTWVLVGDLSA